MRSIAGSYCHCTRSATASPATRRSAADHVLHRDADARHVDRARVRERRSPAPRGRRRGSRSTARGEVTHIRVVRRDRADRVDAGERLADDAARERRRGLVRLARPHGDGRQAQRSGRRCSPCASCRRRGARRSPSARRRRPAASPAHRRPPGRATAPPNTASELANTNFGGAASRRQRSSSRRVASRLTRIPMSKSASACPLTTAARWKTESVSAVSVRAITRGIGEVAGHRTDARIAEVRRGRRRRAARSRGAVCCTPRASVSGRARAAHGRGGRRESRRRR